MGVQIISCEEINAEEYETLKTKPLETIQGILGSYGAPCEKVDSPEEFIFNIVKDHADWLVDILDGRDDDPDGWEEDYGYVSIMGDLEKIAREIGAISTVYTRITYPLKHPALFRFQLDLGEKSLTAGHLLWVYTTAYQMVYALEEEDGVPGHISTNMFNRATLNGPFGIWGHGIRDLCYNGSSEVNVYDDYVMCEFDCDS